MCEHMEGDPFFQKWYIKTGKGLDLCTEPPKYKILFSTLRELS